MDIFLDWETAHALLCYDEPGEEDLVSFWMHDLGCHILFLPKEILYIYGRLHSGNFEIVDYPPTWTGLDSERVVLLRNFKRCE